MFENVYFFLFICLLFFGIGDVAGVATKAKLSSVFVSLFLFLIGFVTGIIPPDIIKVAGLSEIGKWATVFIVFSMGTTINLRELLAEWRTVATAVLSMLSLTVAGFALVPLIGYEETIVAIPILNGGIVATQMMTSAAMEQGFQIAAALGAILYAVQKFVGTPIASYFGLREANALLEEYRRTGVRPHFPGQVTDTEKKPTFFERHKKYYGAFCSLALVGTFSWIAYLIQLATGLSATIWALILGAVVSYLGIVPPNILKHANSSGIFNIAVFASIIPSHHALLRHGRRLHPLHRRALRLLLRPSLLEAHRFAQPRHGRRELPAPRLPGDLSDRERSRAGRRRERRRKADHSRPSDAEVPRGRLLHRHDLLGHHRGLLRSASLTHATIL